MSTINLSQLKLADIPSKEEWIVEQIDKETGLTQCIGKIFVRPTLHLNNIQLEWIHDLCNYGPAQYELQKIEENCLYHDYKAIFAKDMVYIPMKDIDHCNDDIFIRKHSIVNKGYWIYNTHKHSKDTWVYTNKKDFVNYWKKYSKVYEITYFLEHLGNKLGVNHNVNGYAEQANYEKGHILSIDNRKYIVLEIQEDSEANKLYYILLDYDNLCV